MELPVASADIVAPRDEAVSDLQLADYYGHADAYEGSTVALFVHLWEQLDDESHPPRKARLDPLRIPPHLWASILIYEAPRRGGWIYRLVGTTIVNAFGRELTGLAVNEGSTDGAHRFYVEALNRCRVERRPFVVEGTLFWERRDHQPYVQSLCPLLDDAGEARFVVSLLSLR